MAVCSIVHQVDCRQDLIVKQITVSVVEKLGLLGVNIALDLSSVIVQFMKGDPSLDIILKVLRVVYLKLAS